MTQIRIVKQTLVTFLKDYMKVVTENIASPRSYVKTVFAEAEQILSHHKMFQIELADRVRKWDQEGKIGDIFTASVTSTTSTTSTTSVLTFHSLNFE